MSRGLPFKVARIYLRLTTLLAYVEPRSYNSALESWRQWLLLLHFSNKQFVRQMSYRMVLTVIDVTGRVVLHSRWAHLRDCRQVAGVT